LVFCVLTSDFDYDLPPELIAQRPAQMRDASRLLHIHRPSGGIHHRQFSDFPSLLAPGDLLVFNESKVIPARLRAFRVDAPGEIEVLLLEEVAKGEWLVMARPGRRLRVGDTLGFVQNDGSRSALSALVVSVDAEGKRVLRFTVPGNWSDLLFAAGRLPLPPYVSRPQGLLPEDLDRYQTVYARVEGSVAAPTAGLHFTAGTFADLAAAGVGTAKVVLHVGAGTFAPVKTDRVEDHLMHEERFEIPPETAAAARRCAAVGGRLVAIGTTSLRALEASARANGGRVTEGAGRTALFIRPGDSFSVVNALLTNFHLPRSTLLMLVGAFAAPGRHPEGRDLIRSAYAEAVARRYRFFSYGDAMFID
jgi:S-adenosylmethionine:tRNA ribosyltransferase-isomerase